jgi:surface antigen
VKGQGDRRINEQWVWFRYMKLGISSALIAALMVAPILSSCNTTAGKATLGKLSPIKSNPSATFITALDGGIVQRTGITLSDSDKQRALEAEYRALEAAPGGQPVAWSGRTVSGQVVAAAPYQVGSQNCRQYTHTVTVGDKPTVARGAACRNDDGTWSPLE